MQCMFPGMVNFLNFCKEQKRLNDLVYVAGCGFFFVVIVLGFLN